MSQRDAVRADKAEAYKFVISFARNIEKGEYLPQQVYHYCMIGLF